MIMTTMTRYGTILMVDDDPEDCLIARDALAHGQSRHDLRTVADGEELFDYLYRQGRFEVRDDSPRPDLILLDLNMPRKDGRQALEELKTDPRWRQIPIVVLTTSTADDDVEYAYRMGASSFIAKPSSYMAWVELMRMLAKYWFELAKLPP
jgi:CheY-like chemotaxis protein